MEKNAPEGNENYLLAAGAGQKLYKELKKASDLLLHEDMNKEKNWTRFKEIISEAIKVATPELQIHRGVWENLSPSVRLLLGIVATLFVVPAAFVAVFSKHGYTATFFSEQRAKTDSIEQLDLFERSIPKVL